MTIRLYERIPDGVTVDGKFIPCDFDFRNVLKMLDIMQREDVYPSARDFLCVKCVAKHPRKIKNPSAKADMYPVFWTLSFELNN